MTTTNSMFQPRSTRSAFRAAAILGLCAALFAGFVAHASQAPAQSPDGAVASTVGHGRSV